MALKQYRVWITVAPEEEKYILCEDMEDLARWFCEKDKPLSSWGIEKFTESDNTWVDAFYCDDLIQLMWKMRDILLKI